MKKLFLLLILISGLSSIVIAQNRMRMGMGKDSKPMQRIEQWEKLKLIEVLDLNEEISVRFFTRRRDNQIKLKEILDQRDQIMRDLEEDIKSVSQTSDTFYKEQISKIISLENNITSLRESFVRSLNDLLTPQQIAKLLVFESNFRREVRETLMRRGKEKPDD